MLIPVKWFHADHQDGGFQHVNMSRYGHCNGLAVHQKSECVFFSCNLLNDKNKTQEHFLLLLNKMYAFGPRPLRPLHDSCCIAGFMNWDVLRQERLAWREKWWGTFPGVVSFQKFLSMQCDWSERMNERSIAYNLQSCFSHLKPGWTSEREICVQALNPNSFRRTLHHECILLGIEFCHGRTAVVGCAIAASGSEPQIKKVRRFSMNPSPVCYTHINSVEALFASTFSNSERKQ